MTGDLALRRGLGGRSTRPGSATRRLRSTLRVFADVLSTRTGPRAFDAELSWYAALLGEVRDREVQRARFAKAIAALPDEQVLGPGRRPDRGATCWAEQVQHRQALDKAMNGRRYLALLRESRRWVTDPPFTDLAGRKPSELEIGGAGRREEGHQTPGRGSRPERGRRGTAQGPQGRETRPVRRRTRPPGAGQENQERA